MLQVVDPSSLLWAILRLYVTTLICLIPLSICLLYSLLRLIKCTDASEASILCSLAGCAFYGIVISSLWREDLQSQSKTKAPPIVLKVYTLSSESNEDDDGDDSIRPRKRCDMMSPCPICLEEFSDGDKVCYGEQCDHFYHACCICQWTERHHTGCPLCRQHLLRQQNDVFATICEDLRMTVGMS